ncbi:MAG: hypothetical protein AB1428_06725, partial [Bacteroidota bacterium]
SNRQNYTGKPLALFLNEGGKIHKGGIRMTTGQTILTLGAFMFLTTLLTNFYGLVAQTGDTIKSGQDGILATTIASSYMEIAQGLAFDQITDTSNAAIHNVSVLTSTGMLGAEFGEDSIAVFNDFDDFNGQEFERQALGSDFRYRTRFSVYYVDPDELDMKLGTRTFVKRMDLETWRVYPPPLGEDQIDTIRTSVVAGYFHFD